MLTYCFKIQKRRMGVCGEQIPAELSPCDQMASAAAAGVRLGLGRGECCSAPAPALQGRRARPRCWKDPRPCLPRSPRRFPRDLGGSRVPVVFPGPAHPELGAVTASSSGAAERCRDRGSKERSWNSNQAGEEQSACACGRGTFVPCSPA